MEKLKTDQLSLMMKKKTAKKKYFKYEVNMEKKYFSLTDYNDLFLFFTYVIL